MIRIPPADPAVRAELLEAAPDPATAPRLTLTVMPAPAPGMIRSLDPALMAEAPAAGAAPLAGLRAPERGPGPARGRWASAHPARGMA
jgi:hypothetical protein